MNIKIMQAQNDEQKKWHFADYLFALNWIKEMLAIYGQLVNWNVKQFFWLMAQECIS